MHSGIWFLCDTVAVVLSFPFIALWYVVPRLRTVPRATALLPLLLVHTFRTAGLTFLVPGVTGAPPLPLALAAPAAFGDLLSAVLAFVAVFARRPRWPFALGLVWGFTIQRGAHLLFRCYPGLVLRFPTL